MTRPLAATLRDPHVMVRRDPDGTWWWMCFRPSPCGEHPAALPLLGSLYPTHADALAGANDHLARAATRTPERSAP